MLATDLISECAQLKPLKKIRTDTKNHQNTFKMIASYLIPGQLTRTFIREI